MVDKKISAQNQAMGEILQILLIGSFVRFSIPQNKYCDTKFECHGKKHTMCEYQEEADKGNCKGQVNAFTNDSKQMLLGLHNYVRDYMAAGNVPGWKEAANMRQIGWDNDLAEVAQRWAFQCKEGHDECRITERFMTNVGQNYGRFGSEEKFDPNAVYKIFNLWLDEIVNAPPKIQKKFKFDGSYAHYTQLVWAETFKMGCGIVNLTTNETGYTDHRTVVVCNYGPGGNVKGAPMWIKGDVGSKCAKGSKTSDNSTYRNLCALPEDPKDEVPITVDIPSSGRRKFQFVSIPFLTPALRTII